MEILAHLSSLTKIANMLQTELSDLDAQDCIDQLNLGVSPHEVATSLVGFRALRDTEKRIYKGMN